VSAITNAYFFAQLLFDETFAQICSFADVNCADVALSFTPMF